MFSPAFRRRTASSSTASTEGNGTLTLGTAVGTGTTTFTTARPIAVGGETATINLNGNITTLTGQIVSLGVNGVGIGNATGFSDLTIDDNANNNGVLILSTASPNFFGNIIIGNVNAPTVKVMNDAALGNTTGPAALIGQIDLNSGTLQAGASFSATERNIFLGSGSQIDVNGFNTSWGTLDRRAAHARKSSTAIRQRPVRSLSRASKSAPPRFCNSREARPERR